MKRLRTVRPYIKTTGGVLRVTERKGRRGRGTRRGGGGGGGGGEGGVTQGLSSGWVASALEKGEWGSKEQKLHFTVGDMLKLKKCRT